MTEEIMGIIFAHKTKIQPNPGRFADKAANLTTPRASQGIINTHLNMYILFNLPSERT